MLRLQDDIQNNRYQHQTYELFVVHDPKRREIAVATVRDRVVHRLLYEYLVKAWDKLFVYDAWSCRPGKGLLGAINRAQTHANTYRHGWVWRSDITKFFDSVDKETLRFILRTKLKVHMALHLLDQVIDSYNLSVVSRHGLPIGNLTSQIFANIYLNEFDQFVLHSLKPLGYVRYGDDFVLWLPSELAARQVQLVGAQFLSDELKLSPNPRHDYVQPAHKKLSYLGVDVWPNGRRLQRSVRRRIERSLSLGNLASYKALTDHHQPPRSQKQFLWQIVDKIDIV